MHHLAHPPVAGARRAINGSSGSEARKARPGPWPAPRWPARWGCRCTRSASCSACRPMRASTMSSWRHGFRRSRSQTAHGIGAFQVPWAFRLDPLSGMMLLVVTGIGLLIHVYSTGYMQDEPRGGYARFFCYLNLFCFFMLMLVLGGNFLVMFVGWEGVGLCSYLLIGYWYEKKSAGGRREEGVHRQPDRRLGIPARRVPDLLHVRHARFPRGRRAPRRRMPVETQAVALACSRPSACCCSSAHRQERADSAVRLAAGRDGRADAGLGADPCGDHGDGRRLHGRPERGAVRARADGDGRSSPMVGALTALMAATIGLVQNDIKRVLAYSTVSQLGYMFLAARTWARSRAARIPPDDPRVLQGAALPRQRLGDSRDGGRAGHAEDGRAEAAHAGDVRHDVDRHAGDRGHPSASPASSARTRSSTRRFSTNRFALGFSPS